MKKIAFLLLSVLLFSCSSKDDEPKVTDFTLNVSELEMTVGETFKLEMHITNPNKDFPRSFWSDNESIANINSDGLITAKSEGETSISVDYGNISKSVGVRVKARKQTLEEYYREYCFGYKVKDTTDFKVISANISELNNSVYLGGLRNNKLWIGKFDKQTKEQIKEYLDVEDFELNKKIDVGYGKFEDLKVEKIGFTSIYENENGWIAHIDLLSKEGEFEFYYNNYDLFVFNEANTTKKYYTGASTYSIELKKWYNDSYILPISIDDIFSSKALTTCFNSKGDILLTTEHNILWDDVFPTNYDSYIQFRKTDAPDESDNYNKCIEITYNKFSRPSYDTSIFQKYYFYKNTAGERDFIFDVQYLELKNNVLTFKINLTFKSGAKESHTYEFNTKELTIKEI